MTSRKDWKRLERALVDAGWTPVKKTKGTAYRHPSGSGTVMIHYSTSDWRAWRNILRDIRKIDPEFRPPGGTS